MTEARKPRNPLKRGRWAGEKSRVRASIVGSMSDRRHEMRKRGANKNQSLDVPGELQDRGPRVAWVFKPRIANGSPRPGLEKLGAVRTDPDLIGLLYSL
jgi:hypothetical protein